MSDKRIRVLIVDDSVLAREMLAQILATDPDIEVIGQAADGAQAIEMVARLEPDLVTMDIHMPHVGGIEAVEHIMAYTPVPILVVSSSVRGPGIGTAFDALELGALEVMKKPEPRDWAELEHIGHEIIRKVKLLSRVKVITHISGRHRSRQRSAGRSAVMPRVGKQGHSLVAIGSSTGGPSALMSVFGALPTGFPLPILVSQHIADGFIPGLVAWLNTGSNVVVQEAVEGEVPQPGCAYLAPTGLNLEFDGKVMRFIKPDARHLYIPCVDSLFKSVARSLRSRAIGVLLTGMGADGAQGLKAMREAGAPTIAQDEETSTVYGMPRAAVELDAADMVLPVEEIGAEIARIVE